jgi:MFS family permease
MADETAGIVRRNTIVLALCMALSWAVVQLYAALGAVTLATLARPAVAGFAPAVFLGTWAVATLVVGRFMDRHGRAAGLRLGFLVGAVGSASVFLGTRNELVALFLLGMGLVGGGAGAVNLARAGAADMYPPERRGRGVSYVLVGAAFGAILGPIAFTPLLAGGGRDPATLAGPWVPAAAVMLAGVALTFAIRVDPIRIARQRAPAGGVVPPLRSLAALWRLPIVRAAVVVAVLAQGVMSTMMSIVGVALVDHGHELSAVALTMSSHFLGMFGLVLVVGPVVDRIGRDRAILGGMVVLAIGCLGLAVGLELGSAVPAMFAIGVGWNLAFVAATAMISDATEPHERARLLGFADFLAIAAAAGGSVVAGAILGTVGSGPMALGGAALALLPVTVFLFTRPRRARVSAPV